MAINTNYINFFRRTSATTIDMTIVVILRIFAAQIIGLLWINSVIQNFLNEFQEHFGTEYIKNDASHIEFIIHHNAFSKILIFYFMIFAVGAIYHIYLNSSSWQATLGKRVLGIIMVNENQQKISFSTAFFHYLLSILPIIFIIYLVTFQIGHNITLIQSITYSKINVFFGFLSILWIQIHSFTKQKTTAYDIICKLVFIEGKTAAKFPWSKK